MRFVDLGFGAVGLVLGGKTSFLTGYWPGAHKSSPAGIGIFLGKTLIFERMAASGSKNMAEWLLF